MKARIGKTKITRYFAKLDMTNGYWQAPLSENSNAYTTAFTECSMSVFEWNRASGYTILGRLPPTYDSIHSIARANVLDT